MNNYILLSVEKGAVRLQKKMEKLKKKKDLSKAYVKTKSIRLKHHNRNMSAQVTSQIKPKHFSNEFQREGKKKATIHFDSNSSFTE